MSEWKMELRRTHNTTAIAAPEALYYVPDSLLASGLGIEVILAWSWLYRTCGYRPRAIEVNLRLLGARFFKSPRAASKWIDRLCELGLVERLQTKRGRGGYTALRVLDPAEVLEGFGRPICPPGQQEFAFLDDDLDELKPDPSAPQGPVFERSTDGKPDLSARQGPVLVCAAEATDDEPLPALLRAMKSHLGADRFQVWLAPCKWALDAQVLRCVAPSAFSRAQLQRLLGRELRGWLLSHSPELRLDFDVEPVAQKPDPSAPQGPVLGAQTNKLVVGKTLQESFQPNKQQQTTPAGDAPELLPLAAEIYRAVGDPSLYRWFALGAALELLDGRLSAEGLAELVRERAGDFARAMKERGLAMYPLKMALRARGIKWRREWEANAEGSSQTKGNRR